MVPDQKQVWDKKHSEGEHEGFRNDQSPFAQLAAVYLSPESKILELGCGVGRDAVFFAREGHSVLATDFSSVIVQRNKEAFAATTVQFAELDMQQPLPYKSGRFDAVYANLSLHYYSDAATKAIVDEITRVLKPGGVFAFACKSVHDFHYGNGKELEENFFISSTGHARHLFTLEYAQQLVESSYKIVHLKEVTEIYSGQKSAMIQCIVKKKG